MCLVELVLSTQPCRHRWYRLVESCSPHTGLDTCHEAIKLAGPEVKVPYCQFCDEGLVSNPQEYKLIGSDKPSTCTTYESTAPLSSSNSATAHAHRHRAAAALGISETELKRRQAARNISMNRRLGAYVDGRIHPEVAMPTMTLNNEPQATNMEDGPKPQLTAANVFERSKSKSKSVWSKFKEGFKKPPK